MHDIVRFCPMAGLDHLVNLLRQRNHHGRISRREVELPNIWSAGEVLPAAANRFHCNIIHFQHRASPRSRLHPNREFPARCQQRFPGSGTVSCFPGEACGFAERLRFHSALEGRCRAQSDPVADPMIFNDFCTTSSPFEASPTICHSGFCRSMERWSGRLGKSSNSEGCPCS